MALDRLDPMDLPTAVVLVRPGQGSVVDLVVDAVESSGFAVPGGPVGRGLELIERVADVGPALVVVDLAQAGVLGTRLISIVRTIAPTTMIQVLVPFAGLLPAATNAGADAAHLKTDLRGFRKAISSLAGLLTPGGA